jgi:predicted Rossmann fold nucleotide-binding protein DprA/Smf involved in DNA uptake
MAERIISSGGAIVSEYAPDISAKNYTFLCRNRLIAAHSIATIIIEAPLKSGAMNTAKHAIKLKKLLFAIPWDINHIEGKGCNHLIKNGARILTSYAEVLCEISNNSQITFDNFIDDYSDSNTIEHEYLHYYNFIKERQSVSINDIYDFFKSISVSDINSDLLIMEINGYIKQDTIGNYSIN